MAKTRVAPIKRLTIPHLELCGATLLARVLHYISKTLNIAPEDIHASTNSLVVLNWSRGDPRQFKISVVDATPEVFLPATPQVFLPRTAMK